MPGTAGAYPTAPWRIDVSPKAAPADTAPADGGHPSAPVPLDYPAEFAPAAYLPGTDAGHQAGPDRTDYPPKLAQVHQALSRVVGYPEEADIIRFPVGVAPSVAGGYVAEAGPDDYPATGYPPEAGAGYPAELMHELTEPTDDAAATPLATAQFAGSPREGSTLSPGTLPHREPGAAATSAGPSVSDDWPPRREPRRRGRGRWVGITAAVVLTAGAGGAAYAAVHHETSAKPEPSVTTPVQNSPAVSP